MMRSKHLTSHCSVKVSEFSFGALCWSKISEMHFPSLMPGFASGIRWAFLCVSKKIKTGLLHPLFILFKKMLGIDQSLNSGICPSVIILV